MKTIKNIFGVLLVLTAMASFFSCGDDEPAYTPAEKMTNAQVFFLATNSTSMVLTKEENSFEVQLGRVKTDDAITVPLTLTGDAAAFTAPASVAFAAGASTATIVMNYDIEKLEYGVPVMISLNIDDNFSTPYAIGKYELTAERDPWKPYAIGDYTYSLFFEGDDTDLVLYRHVSTPTRWKIEHWGGDTDFLFTYDVGTGKITADTQLINYNHPSYGAVSVKDMGAGSYKDGVFYFSLQYYVSAGNFGSGLEKFTPTEVFE